MESPSENTPKKSHLWARDPNDWYVEEPWCWAAFFKTRPFDHLDRRIAVVDPFCGMGRVLDAAADAGHVTVGFDRLNRGLLDEKCHGFEQMEFSVENVSQYLLDDEFVICTNPPYGGGAEEAKRDPRFARELFRKIVWETGAIETAMLLRTRWANSIENSLFLQNEMPLKRILAFAPRPSCPPGAVVLAAQAKEIDPMTGKPFKVGGGQEDYSIYVFDPSYPGPATFGWLRKPKRGARL